MEKVSVKLVIFKEGRMFCGYSPELMYYINNKTSEEAIVKIVKRHLSQELCHRLRYDKLKKLGWEVFENSVIPPIFADTEVVQLTEQLYEAKIVEPKIIVVDVELPPTQNLW